MLQVTTANGLALSGTTQTIGLYRGFTYEFDLSHTSMQSSSFGLVLTRDDAESGHVVAQAGSQDRSYQYMTGIIYTDTAPGSAGASMTWSVPLQPDIDDDAYIYSFAPGLSSIDAVGQSTGLPIDSNSCFTNDTGFPVRFRLSSIVQTSSSVPE